MFALIALASFCFIMAFAYWEANTYLTIEQQVGSPFERRCNLYLTVGIAIVITTIIYLVVA